MSTRDKAAEVYSELLRQRETAEQRCDEARQREEQARVERITAEQRLVSAKEAVEHAASVCRFYGA